VKIQVFRYATPCHWVTSSPHFNDYTTFKTTQHHNQENLNLQQLYCDNLKSRENVSLMMRYSQNDARNAATYFHLLQPHL